MVRRFIPGNRNAAEIETLTIFANVLQHTSDGGLIFSCYMLDPIEGPCQRVREGYSSWIDFKEVLETRQAGGQSPVTLQ